jgi:hypothetical protein
MILYTVVINPFLGMLDRDLTGMHVADGTGKLAHFAYADDVTLILTRSTDIAILRDIIHIYEQT